MAEIKLRADEAREMASHVQSEASTAHDQMNSLHAYLSNLADSFTGQAATAFENEFNDWKSGADQMLDGLDGLGQFLSRAADTIESTDQEIAGQLSG